jgi:hypothetical protein
LLAPWFVVRAWLNRTRPSIWIAGSAVLSGLVQGYFIATTSALIEAGSGGFRLLDNIEVYSFRLFGTFWLGYGAGEYFPLLWLVVALAAAVACGFFLFSAEIPRQSKMLVGAAASFVGPVIIKFLHEPEVMRGTVNGDRYFFLPHVILAWILISLTALKRPWLRLSACVLLAAAFLGNLSSFRVAPLADLHWEQYVPSIRAGGALKIPINPGFEIRSPGKDWDRKSALRK